MAQTAKDGIKAAAAVLRVSSAQQRGTADDPKGSIDGQREMAERMAADRAWTLRPEHVYDETADTGFQSGRASMNDRPYIQQMLAAAKRKEFGVVIFRDPSRLGREDIEALTLGKALRERGVLVAFSSDGRIADINDSMDRVVFYLGQWQADVDHSNILNNQAAGRFSRADKGFNPGGNIPVGYRVPKEGPDKGRFVVDEKYAPVVRFAFERMIAGDTPSETARKLNERFEFLPIRGGEAWSSGHIHRWMRQPMYRGAGFTRHISKRIRPEKAERSEVVIPAPAIVTPETWFKANRLAEKTTGEWRALLARREKQFWEYALRGRMAHVEADGRHSPMFGEKKGHSRRRYRCGTAITRYKDAHPGTPPCSGFGPARNGQDQKSCRAALVEAVFIRKMVEALRSPEALRAFVADSDRRALAVEQTEDTMTQAKALRERLDRELERVNVIYQKGRRTEAETDLEVARLRREMAEADDRIARLNADKAEAQAFAMTIDDVMSATRTFSLVDVQPGDDPVEWVSCEDIAVEALARGDVEAAREALAQGDLRVPYGTGWDEALDYLERDAKGVLEGRVADLSPQSIEWAAVVAGKFGVKGFTESADGVGPAVRFTGNISLGGAVALDFTPGLTHTQGEGGAAAPDFFNTVVAKVKGMVTGAPTP
jgi:DNA invertase Pin-like site-specific DNA recombinase